MANTILSPNQTPVSTQTFQNFFPANMEVMEALRRMALARFKFNQQVFIVANKGCGSSHLLFATQNYLINKFGKNEVKVFSAESICELFSASDLKSASMQKVLVDMLSIDFLLLDNVHEWIAIEKVYDNMKVILADRLEKKKPVIFSIHTDAETLTSFPVEFPTSSDAATIESEMPGRQMLYKILRYKLAEHPEQKEVLPEYALFYALSKNFKNVEELIQFVFELREQSSERLNNRKCSAGMMENVVDSQFKKWKK